MNIVPVKMKKEVEVKLVNKLKGFKLDLDNGWISEQKYNNIKETLYNQLKGAGYNEGNFNIIVWNAEAKAQRGY